MHDNYFLFLSIFSSSSVVVVLFTSSSARLCNNCWLLNSISLFGGFCSVLNKIDYWLLNQRCVYADLNTTFEELHTSSHHFIDFFFFQFKLHRKHMFYKDFRMKTYISIYMIQKINIYNSIVFNKKKKLFRIKCCKHLVKNFSVCVLFRWKKKKYQKLFYYFNFS